MHKTILTLLAAFLIGAISTDRSAGQDDMLSSEREEAMRQMELMENLMEGIMPGPHLLLEGGLEEYVRLGITDQQMQEFDKKMTEASEPFEEELQEKYGDPDDISPENLGEVAESMTAMISKFNGITDKIMQETFSPEAIKSFEKASFQKYGGTFGGALNVKNLGPLNLTGEQKEGSPPAFMGKNGSNSLN